MAEVNHNLLEVIQMAIKLSKLEQHPVGSLWATMSDDDPAVVFGGGVWKKLGECRVLQCADDDHPAGTTEEAGLPDIQGELVLHGSEQASIINGTSGAITIKKRFNSYRTPAQLTESLGATSGGSFTFKASSYNSIYGNSRTVQPPALTMRYYIKY